MSVYYYMDKRINKSKQKLKEKYIELINDFISNNSLKYENLNHYMVYILNRLISAVKDTTKPNLFDFKKYLNFSKSKEYFEKYSKYKFSLNQFKIRFAIRISLLLAISFTAIRAFNIPKGYWIPMTIFLLTMPFYEDSKKRVSLRFKGTVIGLIASFILFSIFTTHFFSYNNTYYMYKFIKTPGVLIEAGFISNPSDNYLLRQEDYQNKLIALITDAIEKYYQKD